MKRKDTFKNTKNQTGAHPRAFFNSEISMCFLFVGMRVDSSSIVNDKDYQ